MADACLCSYFVSAKTGDNVASAFYRIVADIADIILTSPDISNAAKVITAQVINHPQDELNSSMNKKHIRSQTRCCIM
jgi:Ras-related protein Rab-28